MIRRVGQGYCLPIIYIYILLFPFLGVDVFRHASFLAPTVTCFNGDSMARLWLGNERFWLED